MFRPRLALRIVGPIMMLAGAAVAATGTRSGVALAVIGIVAAAAWRVRVEVDETHVHFRRLIGATEIAIDDVREVGLRRVPLGPPRPPHRSFRFGRFSSTPIRLRVVGGEDVIQLTVAWWDDWAALTRVLLALPGVETDTRTRGRLDRYG